MKGHTVVSSESVHFGRDQGAKKMGRMRQDSLDVLHHHLLAFF